MPDEISMFKDCIIFDENKYNDLAIEMNKDTKIGDVELDEDERSILKMNPKFAVMKRIKLEDIE